MPVNLSILYRGPLSSCNYECFYCPFGKHHETAAELAIDRAALQRFVNWIESRQQDALSIFFTPWGEALTRKWYPQSIIRLTQLPQIRKVAVQTNLSAPLDWLAEIRPDKLGLWCTFHPSQTTRERFLAQCAILDRHQVRYSVGMVGLKEDFPEMRALRQELPPHVYFWVNAYKDVEDYYTCEEHGFLQQLDPLFMWNTIRYPSRGKPCRAGESVISVDGDGTVRRCHFIKAPLGSLYEIEIETLLKPRLCTNATCGCHIGYVHLEELEQDRIYGNGILERVPISSQQLPVSTRDDSH